MFVGSCDCGCGSDVEGCSIEGDEFDWISDAVDNIVESLLTLDGYLWLWLFRC